MSSQKLKVVFTTRNMELVTNRKVLKKVLGPLLQEARTSQTLKKYKGASYNVLSSRRPSTEATVMIVSKQRTDGIAAAEQHILTVCSDDKFSQFVTLDGQSVTFPSPVAVLKDKEGLNGHRYVAYIKGPSDFAVFHMPKETLQATLHNPGLYVLPLGQKTPDQASNQPHSAQLKLGGLNA